jgi:hypothetical protein
MLVGARHVVDSVTGMGHHPPPSPARLRRLGEELEEADWPVDGDERWRQLLLEEVDHALRPPVFERRVPSHGAILEPSTDPAGWEAATELDILLVPVGDHPLQEARRFADGLSSWIVRRLDGVDQWCVFDRPAGSERDLVVLSAALGATLVQRHPTGSVRVAGPPGVLRWEGLAWRLEPPLRDWIGVVTESEEHGDPAVLAALLEFAVHDLGSRGIGAILVHRTDDAGTGSVERRLPPPPSLQIRRPSALAPLRHALHQVDGAAIFDASGTLVQLGARLVPSVEAEDQVDGYRGMRHTAGRRYSFDDPRATVIVVSEDGPVTVLRNGELVGTSPTAAATG